MLGSAHLVEAMLLPCVADHHALQFLPSTRYTQRQPDKHVRSQAQRQAGRTAPGELAVPVIRTFLVMVGSTNTYHTDRQQPAPIFSQGPHPQQHARRVPGRLACLPVCLSTYLPDVVLQPLGLHLCAQLARVGLA